MRVLFLFLVLVSCADTDGREVSCSFIPPSSVCGPYEGCCEGLEGEPWDQCWFDTLEGRYPCARPDDCDGALRTLAADVCDLPEATAAR